MTDGVKTDLNLDEIDRGKLFHPSTHMRDHASGKMGTPRIIETGQGIRIRDTKGQELIDGFAGLYCVNVGYGRMEIADAIYEQAKKLAYYHTYVGHSNEPAIRLSHRIMEMAPAGMSKVFYGLTGSDANETQIKLVWYYHHVLGKPQKRKIISRLRGYHGSGIMTGSMTGLPIFQNYFNLPVDDVQHTVTPHYYREAAPGMTEREFSKWCAEELEKMILAEDPDTVAAFIGEPVLGTGGIIPPPEGYWEEIQPVLKKYEILLIVDEVITGFGRLGKNFGSDLYDIRPDLMTVAKGLTSAYLPLSGVIVSDQVWSTLEEGSEKFGPIGHGWTYSGHALSAAAALANLEIIEKENLTENAKTTGGYFLKRLHDTFDDHPLVGEVRGEGLLAGLEFVSDKSTRARFDENLKVGYRVSTQCLQNGLIARAMPHGDILGFAPPLILTRADADQIVEITQKSVETVTEGLRKEGVWNG